MTGRKRTKRTRPKPKPRAADLRAARKALLGVYTQLKERIEARDEQWNGFAAALQGAFNEGRQEHLQGQAARKAVAAEMEQKLLNLAARLDGSRQPFPKLTVSVKRLVKKAEEILEEMGDVEYDADMASDLMAQLLGIASEEEAENEDEDPEEAESEDPSEEDEEDEDPEEDDDI